jgi:hypothetical protein
LATSSAPDSLLGALRALTAADFEQLAAQLPTRWIGPLAAQGINLDASGFGVIFKARWQSLSRQARAELAEALGAAAARLAGQLQVGPKLQAAADAYKARHGLRAAGTAPALAPGMAADQLRAAGQAAAEALAGADTALRAGRPCPDELAPAVTAYNQAMATARATLADHGTAAPAAGLDELLAGLRTLAANADREPLRAAAAAFADLDPDLVQFSTGRRLVAALLATEPGAWDAGQLSLAEGLTAVAELRRLVAAGAAPAELLQVAAMAERMLPAELHGLVVLAASGAFPPGPGLLGRADVA